jgi:AcrR family transcriptional regulator
MRGGSQGVAATGRSEKEKPLSTRRRATRRALLRAAEQCFLEEGYHATSVLKICKRASTANGTFYLYFDSKDALYRELAGTMAENLEAALNRAIREGQDAVSRSEAVVQTLIDFIWRERALFQIFREAEFVDRGLAHAFYEKLEKAFQGFFPDGGRRSRFGAVAYFLLGSVYFNAIHWALWKGRRPPRGLLPAILDFVREGLDPSGGFEPRPVDRIRLQMATEMVGFRATAAQKGAMTRRKLLRAAEQCFGRAGYGNTSVSDITDATGVSVGSFYSHFKGKSEILEELVGEINRKLRTVVALSVPEASDGRDMQIKALTAFLHFLGVHRGIYRIVREAEFNHKEVGVWYYRDLAADYSRGLTVAMGKGEIRAMDPEVLAYALMGVGHFVGLRWILWEPEGARVPGEILRDTVELMLRGIRGVTDRGATAGGAPGGEARREADSI